VVVRLRRLEVGCCMRLWVVVLLGLVDRVLVVRVREMRPRGHVVVGLLLVLVGMVFLVPRWRGVYLRVVIFLIVLASLMVAKRDAQFMRRGSMIVDRLSLGRRGVLAVPFIQRHTLELLDRGSLALSPWFILLRKGELALDPLSQQCVFTVILYNFPDRLNSLVGDEPEA
jgi:hypothetical protein